MIYLFAVLIILIFYLVDHYFYIPFTKEISFLVLWLISGLRFNVGIDYNIYSYIYYHPLSTQAAFVEPIYLYVNKILRNLGFSSQSFFLLVSFVTLFFIFRGIKKYSTDFYLSLLLYVIIAFYFESMNLIRQYLALSVFFIAYEYILKKNFFKYLLCIIVASLFHLSVLIMIPFYFILRTKFSRIVLLAFVVISLIFSYINIISFLLKYILMFVSDNKYLVYLYNINPAVSNTGLKLIFTNLMCVVFLVFYDRISKKDVNNYILINFVIIAVIFSNIFINFDVMFRFHLYFYIFIILLIPEFISIFEFRSRFLVGITLCICYSLFTIKNLFIASFLPYSINLNLFR